VLVVVAALLILAVGVLLVVGIERDTARSFVDRQRAELAARAGLEDIRGILTAETANDDFVVLQSTPAAPITPGSEPAPHLFVGRATNEAGSQVFKYRYIPLFSTTTRPPDAPIAAPDVEPLLGNDSNQQIGFTALPYHDTVRAVWLPVQDEDGRTVARYAYWVEDLQSRVDPAIAGNDKGPGGTHARAAWPFPAPGLNDVPEADGEPALDQIALFALDPAATNAAQGELAKTLRNHRKLLVSPDSQLAAAGIQPPLVRLTSASADGFKGDLADPTARAAERGLATGIRPYLEQPLVPYAAGIDPSVAGQPKLNLNRLLAGNRASAVDEMAAFIRNALPKFEDRKGGFPDDYLKTIAANALDYADADDLPSLLDGVYRGIDSYPLTTELVLKVDYRGMTDQGGRQFLNFNIRLFAELYNPNDVDVSGPVRLSYEVALNVSSIGSGTGSPEFDSPDLLDRPEYSTHDLDKIAGAYWSKPVAVTLRPNEYKCYRFADVTYRVDQGPVSNNPISPNTPFSLLEDKAESGSSLMWNDGVVERQQGVVRQQGFIYAVTNGRKTGGYLVGTPDILSKAHLPALLYQKPSSAAFYGNTGDPRISHYLNRTHLTPLDESAYPQNMSPNRRTLRLAVYKDDSATKPKVYARMLPSEWPDGGHDPAVGTWTTGSLDSTQIDDPEFNFAYDPEWKHHAIQRISNRGYFISPSELGHVFDPIMFAPVFGSGSLTDSFWSKHVLPGGVDTWPDARTTAPNPRNPLYGGGNSLRIGRPEHPAFSGIDGNPNRASALLDLFHAGRPLAGDAALQAGPLVRINGHVNINTASRDALRTLAAGRLVMDPILSKRMAREHSPLPLAAPPSEKLELDAPKTNSLADKIADAIIAGRPYASPSGMALAADEQGEAVFGNRKQYPESDDVRWTDSAAEEVFARVYQASTVRSRNFRVWIVAQALGPAEAAAGSARILAEVRKVHTLFVDTGSRATDGGLVPGNIKTRVLSTNEF
jgi:hypothetical protein